MQLNGNQSNLEGTAGTLVDEAAEIIERHVGACLHVELELLGVIHNAHIIRSYEKRTMNPKKRTRRGEEEEEEFANLELSWSPAPQRTCAPRRSLARRSRRTSPSNSETKTTWRQHHTYNPFPETQNRSGDTKAAREKKGDSETRLRISRRTGRRHSGLLRIFIQKY